MTGCVHGLFNLTMPYVFIILLCYNNHYVLMIIRVQICCIQSYVAFQASSELCVSW